jgi:hypothetical protein
MEAQLLDRIYLCGKNVAICGTNETRLAIFFLARHGYSTPHLTVFFYLYFFVILALHVMDALIPFSFFC